MLLSLLKEVRFCKQKFFINKLISDIKYHYLNFSKNNYFYLFNNKLNNAFINYFVKFKTTKGNINKFLSNLLRILFTKKLSYSNINKLIEKL